MEKKQVYSASGVEEALRSARDRISLEEVERQNEL